MHLLGGAAVAYFFLRTLHICRARIGNPSKPFINLMAFSLACNTALLWEFWEYFLDQCFWHNPERGTMRDLILGVSGAIVLVGLMHVLTRRRTK